MCWAVGEYKRHHLWANIHGQLSQPNHSLTHGMENLVEVRKIVRPDKDSLLGKAKAVYTSKANKEFILTDRPLLGKQGSSCLIVYQENNPFPSSFFSLLSYD